MFGQAVLVVCLVAVGLTAGNNFGKSTMATITTAGV